MEREFLNEKKYNKTRKILMSIGFIIIIIGLIFGGGSIYKGIQKSKQSTSIVVPKMGMDGWFEISSNQNHLKFDASKNIGLGIFGLFASIMIGGTFIVGANQRKMLAYVAQSTVPVTKEVIDEMAPTIGRAAGTIAKEAAPGYAEAMGIITPNIGNLVGKIAKETVPVYGEAIKGVMKEIKNESVFCKHCGETIDKDSKFCNKCGKEQ